ncbi:AraC family transcriptional regulator [Nocardiopsis changdeensis]|uniref:AraC family transcriptional regulator n=1 Tax=Nocardiopsis changdeensis TaxID=2831969 RepID=A0ABX8BEC5_9ACTN|nr:MULTISPECIES: AraC family transcriptional regulator [Nocardiopsis]QUX20597.1 AraC family transcriptional regulator [Nocardiopsis changdeensis]QYX36528.1 AraC family transcriptional regulator [Nocardiopsis sp. MT53]
MTATEFDTGTIDAAERYELCRELLSTVPVTPMELTGCDPDGFGMVQRDLHLGEVRVWNMALHPAVLKRTEELIDRSDPGTYNLCFLQRGRMVNIQNAQESAYGPGDLHVINTSRPFELTAWNEGAPVVCTGVELPHHLLPLPRAHTHRLTGRRMAGREGIGGLLTGMLTSLTGAPGPYSSTDEMRLGTVVADLAAALFAQTLEAEDALEPRSRRRSLVLEIRGFVQRNLHDPELTPGAIAAAHHISVGYLHRLFQEEGHTVAAWVREQRLERARGLLADPALAPVPIHRVAARCGFTQPEVFSRTFRRTFGMSPRDYRHGRK